jgi:ATP-binding cassette, subfamily B, bacterial PglK
MSQEAQYKESIFQHLGHLYNHLTPRRRLHFKGLIALMVTSSFFEVFSIGSIFPFLTILSSSNTVLNRPDVQPVINFLKISSPDELLFAITIIFILLALMTGFMRVFLLWATTKLAYVTGSDLTAKVYRNTLYQEYSVHISRNSSEVINSAVSKINAAIQSTIIPVLNIISSAITFVFILCLLLFVEPMAILVLISAIILVYFFISLLTIKKLSNNSKIAAKNHNKVVKFLQEGLGGIRDIILDGSQEIFSDLYKSADIPLRKAQGVINFITQSPRFLIEAFAISFLGILAYLINNSSRDISMALPIIGVLAIGAQRLLPIIQQIYASKSSILGARASVADTLFFLDQSIPNYVEQSRSATLSFDKHIYINNLNFSYESSSPVILMDINLKIIKGSTVGFVGKTGCGKSTLIDLIMGLLSPTDGTLEIDGTEINQTNIRLWQKHIAHVPQSIFLTDNTIEQNIAFGVPAKKIDKNHLEFVTSKAHIANTIEKMPLGYQSIAGERGVKLSGGQRQRIGLARALYKNSDVLILDEATSALDNETEKKVMQSIIASTNKITTLIVAHRLSTLQYCDKIIELVEGRISRVGSYDEIVSD